MWPAIFNVNVNFNEKSHTSFNLRVQYFTRFQTYKIINNDAPDYLCNLIQDYHLRSQTCRKLTLFKPKFVKLKLWNEMLDQPKMPLLKFLYSNYCCTNICVILFVLLLHKMLGFKFIHRNEHVILILNYLCYLQMKDLLNYRRFFFLFPFFIVITHDEW